MESLEKIISDGQSEYNSQNFEKNSLEAEQAVESTARSETVSTELSSNTSQAVDSQSAIAKEELGQDSADQSIDGEASALEISKEEQLLEKLNNSDLSPYELMNSLLEVNQSEAKHN